MGKYRYIYPVDSGITFIEQQDAAVIFITAVKKLHKMNWNEIRGYG